MLFLSIFTTLVSAIAGLALTNIRDPFFIKVISTFFSGLALLLSCILFIRFNPDSFYFQFHTTYSIGSESLNMLYSFGIDNMSVLFFLLSSLLVFSCTLFIWNEKNFKEYAINLFLIQLFLLIIFSVLDLFLFYIFFEAILVPMYLLIGLWGSRERKIRAVYLFFFYTLCGSILMLLGILYVYFIAGTLNIEYLFCFPFGEVEQTALWLFFFVSFASKIPMFPFHIWLPEAHVEAPTVGSVLLAGILLKLGVYGFIRFSITLFPDASINYSPLIYLLSTIGVLYASLSAIRQSDLKRIIAYSSIAHMNLVTIGIFSFDILGLEGAVLQSISHGFVSGGMFLLIGILYDRYHSRFLYYYGGLVHMMPIYAILFLIFTLANIALPGTSSFVGEFLLLAGIYKTSIITCVIAALGVILCGTYSLWLYNRVIFGNLRIDYTLQFADIIHREVLVLAPLFLLIFIMGLYPSSFSYYINVACLNLTLLVS